MATYSEDGRWLWDGNQWIPSPPHHHTVMVNNSSVQTTQKLHIETNTSLQVKDSMVYGDLVQTNEHTGNVHRHPLQIQDTVVMGNVVQNTYVTQTVNQELMTYVLNELQSLQLNVNSLRSNLDSSKRAQIKNKETVKKIVELNETVMQAELSSGSSLLDKDTYEMLSTVSLSANADGAGYMTHSYGLRVESREEKVKLAQRKARLAFWCFEIAPWRIPEGYKNYIEAAKIWLELRDERIATFSFVRSSLRMKSFYQFIDKWLNIPLTKFFMGRWFRKYEQKASNDPTLPNWSELDNLRLEGREIYLQIKPQLKLF